jgi:predicted O-methyltransferase YrrM
MSLLELLYHFPPPPLAILLSKIATTSYERKKRNFYDTRKLETLLDFAFSFSFFPLIPQDKNFAPFTIRPAQVREEFLSLLKILQNMNLKKLLEIGTARGGTLFLFSRIANYDATIISVDLPGGMFGGGYPKWKIPLYKSFAIKNQRIYLIRADSHNPKTLNKVKEILKEGKLDFLFIDGDHTYEGVKKDFEMYSPLVRNGGIIAFHDIVPGPPEIVGGVPNFWNEIKQKFRYLEIVKNWNQGGYGIGILYV